jgi:hypothetical protein
MAQKDTPAFQELMSLYSMVFCVEMKRRAMPENVRMWLKQTFARGRILVKELHGNVKRHNEIEKIHTKNILQMAIQGGILCPDCLNNY